MGSKIEIQDWGLIDYNEAWEKQKELVEDIQENRDKNVLVFCQHPTVITIGKTGSEKNLKRQKDFFENLGIQVVFNDRGGDVTLHNPGQLVGYPIFNLKDYKQDLHWFLRKIEQCIIDLVDEYGIKAGRVDKLTGVWIENQRKICAMGLRCSRWVTSHGFALNVSNDVSEFDYIVPCGIQDKQVTSMHQELAYKPDFEEVKSKCADIFNRNFENID